MNQQPLPTELLEILNAPCPTLPAEMVERLNAALNENLEEISEKDERG